MNKPSFGFNVDAGDSLEVLYKNYMDYYAATSSHTGKAKRLDLDKFLRFLAEDLRGCKVSELVVKDWDHAAVQRFVEFCLRSGAAPATVARRLATLKHVGRTLAERVPGFVNPAREVRPPTQKALRPKALTVEEIRDVKEIAAQREAALQGGTRGKTSSTKFGGLRNKTLLNLLLDTGLRVDEIRTLKMRQLDPQLRWIESVRTKGRKYRNVYISTEARAELKVYLEEREKELQRRYPGLAGRSKRDLPVFISSYRVDSERPESFEISPKTVWRIINGFSVNTRLHPHLLRHSYAHEILRESKDIRLVAQALGHSDVRTTMKYTERTESEIARVTEQARRRRGPEEELE